MALKPPTREGLPWQELGHWLDAFFSLLFPSPCRVCQGPLIAHRSLICGSCWDGIRMVEPPVCSQCGIPFPSMDSQNFPDPFLCGACRQGEPHFHQARSVGYYEGTLREAIHLFKFGKRQEMGRHLGRLMVDRFPPEWDPSALDFLMPVPLHPRRLRERGFNQSLILARIMSRSLGIGLEPRQLVRSRHTFPQSGLPLGKKFENLKGAFSVRRPEKMEGKNVLLVDDVLTSGATVQEAGKALLKAGAGRVFVLTLARSVLR